MKRLHHAVLVASLLVATLFARTVRAGEDYDNWYVVRLNDQRAGWAHMTQRSSADEIVSLTEMELSIRRDRSTMTIRFDTEFVEARDGSPLRMKVVINNSNVPVEGNITFEDDAMVVRSQGIEQRLDLPDGKWLSPAAANDYVASRLAAGADRIVYRVLEPQLTGIVPTAVTNTITDIEEVKVEALGRTVPGYRCSMMSSSTPDLPLTQFFDSRGQTIRQIIPMGGSMNMEIVIADRDLAMAEIDAPELMRGTLVKPDRPLDRPRDLERATYVVRAKGEALGDLPTTGFQTVERLDARSVRVTVDLSTAEVVDGPTDEVTKPSRMLDASDPEIIGLARESTDGIEGQEARARAMREFVRRHITSKNLGVGLASASEVARTCEGDCTEHAVLLAAMLRADGIPSRVVSGLVYVERFAGERDVFGFHMWTQGLFELEGEHRWIDLDATLPGEDFDAAHIALAVSTLADSEVQNPMVALASMIGNLDIVIEESE